MDTVPHRGLVDSGQPVGGGSCLDSLAYSPRRLSTDDFAGTLANQTDLAIKGTVGIKAMSMIEGILGNSGTAANYSVS